MKIKKGIPLIDQHDKNFMYGGKFGGNFIPETLKKPIDDLTNLLNKYTEAHGPLKGFQEGGSLNLNKLEKLSDKAQYLEYKIKYILAKRVLKSCLGHISYIPNPRKS